MSGLALGIVLLAAAIHASWNYLTKKRMFVFTKPRGQVAEEWSINKWSILSLGFLVLLTYMMILFTMQLSQVSYVVAVREVSIVFSSFYGVSRLGEKHGSQKLIGAVVITIGVISIGLGG
ncbi:MAG TPA: hypothetical protein ENI07_07160 [Desulfobacterales bacterium]|nr:hypothetical protein [Desulfobacterales bacterium]